MGTAGPFCSGMRFSSSPRSVHSQQCLSLTLPVLPLFGTSCCDTGVWPVGQQGDMNSMSFQAPKETLENSHVWAGSVTWTTGVTFAILLFHVM